jgi:sulfur-carrier protein
VQILYFAWVRERIGLTEETLSDAPPTVGALLDALVARGGGYVEALAERDKIRIAVNQNYVGEDHPLSASDEVAIFPPVTGG